MCVRRSSIGVDLRTRIRFSDAKDEAEKFLDRKLNDNDFVNVLLDTWEVSHDLYYYKAVEKALENSKYLVDRLQQTVKLLEENKRLKQEIEELKAEIAELKQQAELSNIDELPIKTLVWKALERARAIYDGDSVALQALAKLTQELQEIFPEDDKFNYRYILLYKHE
jgi:hypothetical protein